MPIDSKVIISNSGLPESKLFGDLYFSREDGLEETKYVFLSGNRLEKMFQEQKIFKIVELGFGTGLNFLATLNCWKQYYRVGKKLSYIGIERFPLSSEQIFQALSRWPELEHKLLLKNYPTKHRGVFEIKMLEWTVELTLIFDDINNALKHNLNSVDAWFLDGFAPSKNPDMWSEFIFKKMAEYSSESATFATFTAASMVRKGLEKAGFNVSKHKGFGRKRDMLVGNIRSKPINYPNHLSNIITEKKAIVIGAGIAGASAAYSLNKRGWEVTVYEKENDIALRASGNDCGILYPRIEAIWNNITEFYYQAFEHLLYILKQDTLSEICRFNQCGLLILPQKEEEIVRFKKIDLHSKESYVKLISSLEASEISGVEINNPCLYLPRSGILSIPKLCKFMLSQERIQVKTNTEITELKFENNRWHIFSHGSLIDSAETLIIANSYAAETLLPLQSAQIQKIRGQVTYLPEMKSELKSVLCYGGYITPSRNGYHHLGATFDKHFFSLETNPESSYKNLAQLNKFLPDFIDQGINAEELKGRVGIRCYSKDKLPLIGLCPNPGFYSTNNNGQHPYLKGLYLSICHGSRGALSGILGGEIIASQINQEPANHTITQETIDLINPARFLLREQRKLL
ncbi:bifunctional tRNA (5-methylaminomethyl-2-thiouridine)(34)-methyltransferase MnmD/FAD-dependent 5-carboxymethylaminomethyl-2-thiouridine(34) oxidoreductase MnmC [Candidatus Jidaibacter acanthamoebae]|nr:bifunctional tRNA (5-methylaminomethyl-2-thiouridine)(34)-methyltransferase MnmD/FAD-dependent 5-carboxymethylaminomethyl-2-thiouridine(34) oxidoreductase MnmC [Candidatus Jidaibacter acanthamoeba]